MTTAGEEEASGLAAAFVAVAGVGALMAVTAAFVWGLRAALSVATGSAIAVSNLYVLSKTVARVMGSGAGGAGAWSILAVLKMVLLVGVVGLLLTRGLVDAMGLVVGYGSLPIGIALSALLSDKTGKG
jgi:hypothetical protein